MLMASIEQKGTSTPNIYHINRDHLGSTLSVSNASGTVIQSLTYHPFGDVNTTTGGTSQSSPLYTDTIQSPWTDVSWNVTKTNSTTTVQSGTASLKAQYATAWGGVAYTRTLDTSPYDTLDFYVYIGTTTPELDIYFTNASGTVIQNRLVANYISGGFHTNTWDHVSIPLSDLGIASYNNTLTFNIESSLAQTVYYDQIQFLGKTSTYTEPNQYIGQDFDPETNLSYLHARYLSSPQGQFTSQDPVFWEIGQTNDGKAILRNPQAANSYSYAQDNPILNKDPNGRIVQLLIAGALAFYGGYTAGTDLYDGYTNGNNGQFAWGVAGSALSVIPGETELKGGVDIAKDAASILAKNREAGVLGEKAAGIIKNTEKIPSTNKPGTSRIPDVLDHGTKVIGDVKNVNYQSFTSQLRDFSQYAQNNAYKFVLTVDQRTRLSQSIQQLGRQIEIVRKNLKK